VSILYDGHSIRITKKTEKVMLSIGDPPDGRPYDPYWGKCFSCNRDERVVRRRKTGDYQYTVRCSRCEAICMIVNFPGWLLVLAILALAAIADGYWHLRSRLAALVRMVRWRPVIGRLAVIGRGVRFLVTDGMQFGNSFSCGDYCLLSGRIRIGQNVSLNNNVLIVATEHIVIGNDCLIGPNVVIRDANHNFGNFELPIRLQGHTSKEIIIGNDVWIGANAVILPGCVIGDGAVVSAGSVVTACRILPGQIFGGVPAREIGNRSRKGAKMDTIVYDTICAHCKIKITYQVKPDDLTCTYCRYYFNGMECYVDVTERLLIETKGRSLFDILNNKSGSD